jgi:hypothetical protein
VSFVVRAATPEGGQHNSAPVAVSVVPFVRQLNLLALSGLGLLTGLGSLAWGYLSKRLLPE